MGLMQRGEKYCRSEVTRTGKLEIWKRNQVYRRLPNSNRQKELHLTAKHPSERTN